MKVINPFRFIYENPIQPIICMDYNKPYVGEVFKSIENDMYMVIDYIDDNNIIIMFLDDNKGINITSYWNLKHGVVKNPFRPGFCNNYLGEGDYNKKDYLKIYQTWTGLFARHTIEGQMKDKNASYINSSICNEWYNYQNFALWYDNYISSLNPLYYNDYQLDKDILQWNQQYKIYSPNTCCLVPKEINKALLGSHRSRRNELPKSISMFEKKSKVVYCPYIVRYGNRSYLGSYSTPQEAFEVYKQTKKEYIRELANKYYSINAIRWNVYQALCNIEILPY